MKKIIILGIFLLTGYSGLFAQQVTQTREFRGTPNFTEVFECEKYNGAAPLESVEIIFEIETDGGFLAVDNDNMMTVETTVELGVRGMISSSDVPLIGEDLKPVIPVTKAVTSATFNLDDDDGDGRERMELNTPDADKHTGTQKKVNNSGIISPTVLEDFIGTGTYELNVILNTIVNFGDEENLSGSFEAPQCSGSITVIYN